MKRGPRPKSSREKSVAGNPGRRSLDAAPDPSAGLPRCPSHLSDAAKKKWRELAADVTWFARVDADLVAAYCTAWGRWVDAEAEVSKTGLVLMGPNGGLYQNPALSVANKAIEQLAKLGALLGLNPTDRGRLKVPEPKGEEDEFAKFMKGQ